MMKLNKIIAVDFDSTLVLDEWPYAGANVPGAFEVVRELVRNGHRIILLTQREHEPYGGNPDVLDTALQVLEMEGIKPYAVNEFPKDDEKFYHSRKIYADVYVDDHCAGIPRKDYINGDGDHSPYVDWYALDKWFVQEGYYEKPILD